MALNKNSGIHDVYVRYLSLGWWP